ncbi:MAG TPA: hypothetical protein VFF54_00540 [Thermodesulfobacteriota bacterium]|nr:hypothetical protein [Thermodesulfobacteriota bacterium]
MKKLLLVLVGIVLVGCVTFQTVVPIVQAPQRISSSTFDVGKVKQTNIGDSMVFEEDILYYEGLAVSSDFQPPSSLGVPYPFLKSGTTFKAFGKIESGETLYALNDELKVGGWDWASYYCLVVNVEGNVIGDTGCIMVDVRQWPQSLPMQKTKIVEKGSSKKELLYQGKSGNTIRLMYREFYDGFARPAFQQDLTYDLAETKIIGFRKMTIEVIEATNSYIKFVVKTPF